MPARIALELQKDGIDNDIYNVVPRLSELIARKSSTDVVYLCYDHVVQIHRLAKEGNHFCGYRNLQMLCHALGSAKLHPGMIGRLSIAQLQQMIEDAWSQGFNADAKVETGGVKGTRKHIGSPEAEALLQSLGIACTSRVFKGKDSATELLDFVEVYFGQSDQKTGVVRTQCMPLFLQRPQHSLSIVGLVKLHTGRRHLLVFDPALPRGVGMRKPFQSRLLSSLADAADLALYRRDERYLRRFRGFEVVAVDASADEESK